MSLKTLPFEVMEKGLYCYSLSGEVIHTSLKIMYAVLTTMKQRNLT